MLSSEDKENLEKFLIDNIDYFFLSEEKDTLMYIPSERHHLWKDITNNWKYPLCVRLCFVSYEPYRKTRVFVKYGNREIFIELFDNQVLFDRLKKRQNELDQEIGSKYLKMMLKSLIT